MAISAKFEADFNQFVAEAEKANGSLGKIEGTSQRVASAMTSMTSTAQTLASAFGIAFSIGAAVQFGKSLVDSAGALVDMSVKTGNSIEQLQRYAFVGAQAKVSTEDLAQANFKLGVALDGGDASVVRAVARLGLGYAQLRAMSPDDQFNATIKALEGLGNEQERNRVAVDLFGKSWATVAPAVAQGYADMAAKATVSSTAQIKAIDDASDAWDRWVTKQKTAITSGLGDIVLLRDAVAKLPEGYALMLLQTDKSITSQELLNAALIRAAATRTDVVLPSIVKHTSLTKAEQEEADKLAAILTELDAVGVGWAGTLDKIDGATVEGIKYYLEAGVAQDKLATAYGLTAAQVASVASALKDETAAQKIATEGASMAAKAWTEYFAKAADLYATDTQRAINKANTDYALAEKAAQDKGIIDVGYYNALWALRDQDVQKSKVDTDALRTNSFEYLVDVYKKAQATFEAMGTDGLHHSQEQIQHFRDLRDNALDALQGIPPGLQECTDALDEMGRKIEWVTDQFGDLATAADEAARKANAVGGSQIDYGTVEGQAEANDPREATLNDWIAAQGLVAGTASWVKHLALVAAGKKKLHDAGVPGFEGGGPTGAGGLSVLHPGEYVVPKGGALVSGGGGTTVNILIQGSVVTERELATRLEERLTRKILQGLKV